jgi:hypothetical protein
MRNPSKLERGSACSHAPACHSSLECPVSADVESGCPRDSRKRGASRDIGFFWARTRRTPLRVRAKWAGVPGTNQVLEIVVKSEVVTEPARLASLALGSNAPTTAMILRVERAELRSCRALEKAHPWDRSTHLPRDRAPNMMALGASMMANQRRWLGVPPSSDSIGAWVAHPAALRFPVSQGLSE